MAEVPELELPGGHEEDVMRAIALGSWALPVAVALASEAGHVPVAVVDLSLGLLRMSGPQGEFLLAATELDAHGPRDDERERARLLGVLESTIAPRRFNTYFREPLPADFDAAPVGAAVQVWLRGLDDPEGGGSRHAIYEDDGVAFEIWLTGEDAAAGQRALGVAVGPMLAEDRLQVATGWMLEVCGAARASAPDEPVVVAVGRRPVMGVPPGMVRGLLYGMPERVQAVGGPEPVHEEVVKARETSLLASGLGAQVAAVWWLDGGATVEARAVAYHNPWAPTVPAFPGRSFVRTGAPVEDEVALAWVDGPSRWRIVP